MKKIAVRDARSGTVEVRPLGVSNSCVQAGLCWDEKLFCSRSRGAESMSAIYWALCEMQFWDGTHLFISSTNKIEVIKIMY